MDSELKLQTGCVRLFPHVCNSEFSEHQRQEQMQVTERMIGHKCISLSQQAAQLMERSANAGPKTFLVRALKKKKKWDSSPKCCLPPHFNQLQKERGEMIRHTNTTFLSCLLFYLPRHTVEVQRLTHPPPPTLRSRLQNAVYHLFR